MAARENKYKRNHPPVDPNDPRQLLQAGLGLTEDVEEEVIEEEVIEEEVLEEVEPTKRTTKKNLLAGRIKKKPKADTFSFHLDIDLVNQIDRLAKQNDISRSKALNLILRDVFTEE